jgi:hypothetical protein
MTIEKKNNSSLSLKSSLPALIFALLAFSFMVITKHHHVRLTADTMLYFSLAEKYISGDFVNAVNGYWGPLLAWLLVPFLYFGVSDVIAINALNLILGIFIIFGVWRLSYRVEMTEMIRSIILISFIPIVLKFSLVQPMDFLLLCFLVYYLVIVFGNSYPDRMTNGIFCGILGTLAYFSKSYAFPFFIIHFLIMNILHYFRNTAKSYRRNVLRNAAAGFVLFFLFSGAWIMAIGDKYGYYTISTMRKTNFNAPGPEAMGGGLEFGVPVFTEGFYEPPNETAFVIWEDPSYLRGKPWSPWQSWTYFKHFIRLVLKNITEGLRIYETFSTLSIAIIISYLLLLCVQPRNTLPSHGSLLYPLFTMVLFSGGYLLFHLEERYLWLVNVLLLLMGGYVLNVLFQKEFFKNNLLKGILIFFFIISFIFTPSKFVKQVLGGGMNSYMYHVSTDLTKYDMKGNIASNREHVPVHDAWHKTFRLAYWLDTRYYGQSKENISDSELEKELKKHDISYYFFWGDSSNMPQLLIQYKELTNGEIPGLKIFSLKDRKANSDLLKLPQQD